METNPMENGLPRGERTRREIGQILGGEIDAARRRAGLSFREGAAHIGISHGYLCELTKGRRAPSTEVAEAIIAVLPMPDDAAAELLNMAVERKRPRRVPRKST